MILDAHEIHEQSVALLMRMTQILVLSVVSAFDDCRPVSGRANHLMDLETLKIVSPLRSVVVVPGAWP
jgi:hypothetical protein